MSRPVLLKYFFIFNRSLGSSEETATLQERAEKFLYFFPFSVELREKVQVLEMIESFLDFAKLFSPSSDSIHSVSLERVTFGILEVEPDTWFCMGINTPQQESQSQLIDAPADGIASRLYRSFAGKESDLDKFGQLKQPSVEAIRSVLIKTYRGMKFLQGGFQPFSDLARLRVILKRIVPWSLSTISFDTIYSKALHNLSGIEHLAVDKTTFLTIHSFMESFLQKQQTRLNETRKAILSYSGQILWSSLTPHQGREIMDYLHRLESNLLFSQTDQGFLKLENFIQDEMITDSGGYQGSKRLTPSVFFENGEKERMVAFKEKKLILVFFLPKETSIALQEEEREKQISEYLQTIQKSSLSADLDRLQGLLEEVVKKSEKETSTNSAQQLKRLESAFIYSNSTNLVIKGSTKYLNWAKISRSTWMQQSQLPSTVIHGLDMVFSKWSDGSGTVCVVNGEWCIVGWKSGTRELYRFSSLVTTLSSSSSQEVFYVLPQLQLDLDKLLESKFSNVFIE